MSFQNVVEKRPRLVAFPITAAINPPAASILRGDVVPPYGGDTQFTNLVAAYNAQVNALVEALPGVRVVTYRGAA